MGAGQSSLEPSSSPPRPSHGKRNTPKSTGERGLKSGEQKETGRCRARRSQIWTDDEVEKLREADTEESLQEDEEDDSDANETVPPPVHSRKAYPHTCSMALPPPLEEPQKKKRKTNPEADCAVKEILEMRKWRTNRGAGCGGWVPRGRLEAFNRAVNSKTVSLLTRLDEGCPEFIALVQSNLVGLVGVYPDPEVSSVLLEFLERLAESSPELALGFLEPLSHISFHFFLRNKLILLSQALLQHSTTLEHLRCLTVLLFRYGSYETPMQIEDIEEWRLAVIRMTPRESKHWDELFDTVHSCFEYMKSNSFTCT